MADKDTNFTIFKDRTLYGHDRKANALFYHDSTDETYFYLCDMRNELRKLPGGYWSGRKMPSRVAYCTTSN